MVRVFTSTSYSHSEFQILNTFWVKIFSINSHRISLVFDTFVKGKISYFISASHCNQVPSQLSPFQRNETHPANPIFAYSYIYPIQITSLENSLAQSNLIFLVSWGLELYTILKVWYNTYNNSKPVCDCLM